MKVTRPETNSHRINASVLIKLLSTVPGTVDDPPAILH